MTDYCQHHVCFFVGPSVPPEEFRQECERVRAHVRVLPPVQQGDLFQLVHNPPDIIGIIDGYFLQVPAVLHKEIMLLMQRGVKVLGASSLGALRAAELHQFGMEGVGEVFRLYKEEIIDADDEVAVVHASGDDGYRTLSEPLVNIRYNLRRAEQAGIISAEVARHVLTNAKRLHFSDRSYDTVLQAAVDRGGDIIELDAFRHFLKLKTIDLKRDDAIELVRTVADRISGNASWPKRAPVPLHRTKYFRIQERDYVGHALDGRHIPDTVVVLYHKLLSPDWPDLLRSVSLGCVARDEAMYRGLASRPAIDLVREFCETKKLDSTEDLNRWLTEHYLSYEDLIAELSHLDFEKQVMRLYETPGQQGVNLELQYSQLLNDVRARTGLAESMLTSMPYQPPGIPWEEPLIRALKMAGRFGQAMEQTSKILQLHTDLLESNPKLSQMFDALLFQACDRIEQWVAEKWQVDLEQLERESRKRGFACYPEFLEAARLAYMYESHATPKETKCE